MKQVRFNVEGNAIIQLGEDLYKNTYGVLIEYITNSYDADATEVIIKNGMLESKLLVLEYLF